MSRCRAQQHAVRVVVGWTERRQLRHRMDQCVGLAVDAQRGIGAAQCHRGAARHIDVVVGVGSDRSAGGEVAIVEHETGRGPRRRDRRVDVDIVRRIERQRGVGRPAHRVIDVDVAVAAGSVGRRQHDAVAAEQSAERGAGDVAA